MSNEFGMVDFIVLLAIAIFFISRLRNVLGKPVDDGKPTAKTALPKQGKMAEIRASLDAMAEAKKAAEEEAKLVANISNAEVTTGLAAIKATDTSFSVSKFLNGANIAFDRILEAFAKGDKIKLRPLLNDEVFADFEDVIDARKTEGTHEETTLVAIKSGDVVRARVNGKMAEITVRFTSEQISVVRDKEGKIVGGDASASQLVTDEWTFSRDLKSPNPNWVLIDT